MGRREDKGGPGAGAQQIEARDFSAFWIPRVGAADTPRPLVADWHYDLARKSEVEVRLVAEGEGTQVELEHRRYDRFGSRCGRCAARSTRKRTEGGRR